MHKANEPMAQS